MTRQLIVYKLYITALQNFANHIILHIESKIYFDRLVISICDWRQCNHTWRYLNITADVRVQESLKFFIDFH